MFDFSRIIGWLEKPFTDKTITVLTSAAVVSSIILFAPDGKLGPLQLSYLRNNFYPFVVLVLVSSLVLLFVYGITHGITKIKTLIKKKRKEERERRETSQKFESLSYDQKCILWKFGDSNTEVFLDADANAISLTKDRKFMPRVNRFKVYGELQDLAEKDILEQQGRGIYRIKPWAKKHLEDNPEILEEIGPEDLYGEKPPS